MKSKFGFGGYFLALYSFISFLILLAALPVIIYYKLDPIAFFLVIFLVIVFVNAWLIFGGLRQKVVVIDIGFDKIILKRYLGLGKPQTIYFTELDGFSISLLPTSTRYYEFLYAKSDGKKVFKLSEFYHRNYTGLKQALSEKLNYLGEENFAYKNEFKDVFSKIRR